ncbi:hypothetical protein POVCU2_0026460 [Plasmodium ovale curtisi]|uniref:Uncharacterized protein n=1 Tax=Plasmodium ovale curtisi TaxID=864141 RepID=A0A1A8VVH8_PLAOA|nr:hypothetical protein POVCU2_0026460 [Plasmodium ovale curtisi]
MRISTCVFTSNGEEVHVRLSLDTDEKEEENTVCALENAFTCICLCTQDVFPFDKFSFYDYTQLSSERRVIVLGAPLRHRLSTASPPLIHRFANDYPSLRQRLSTSYPPLRQR